ncbi:MAG: hypothetical protein M1429_02960 [Patescibacteria group bacterium]|nr:hypothetical protein [Patescibacteria group bacterium]
MKTPNEEINERIIKDRNFRIHLAMQSPYWFFYIYLPRDPQFEIAPFQKEILEIARDESIKLALIVSFRQSGKTTMMDLVYPIWSIIGEQKKKFILIICKDQQQAEMRMANIREELENNELLKKDFGPLYGDDKWGALTVVVARYKARIMCVSSGQSLRGMIHGSHRPDVVVCDDLEDLEGVKNPDNRDKMFNWFCRDIVPMGNLNTKIIVISNLLHEDCLVRRLNEEILKNKRGGLYKEFPLIDEEEKCMWPGMYPNPESIEELRHSVGDRVFEQEYLLHILPEVDQIIHPEWIHRYDELPRNDDPDMPYRGTYCGVDLALKKGGKNDYTAVIICRVYGYDENMRIFVLPYIINEKLDFRESIERLKTLDRDANSGEYITKYIESVGYQSSIIEQLRHEGVEAEEVPIHEGKDIRLKRTIPVIFNGVVLIPRYGAVEFVDQMVYFGSVPHDDMVDAFTMVVIKIIEENSKSEPRLTIIDGPPPWYAGPR